MSLRTTLVLLCLCAPALMSCRDEHNPPDGAAPIADTAAVADAAARESNPAVPPTADTPSAETTEEGPTRGGDGSQIALQPLSAEQLDEADLQGELACSFADDAGSTLLLARADVVPDGMVRAVLNNNGYVETLGNGRAGGFNDLLDGISLAGKGLAVELERGESQPTGDEATRHAATLKVMRADGAERTYNGTLACGP